ncbi:MAG: galactokinase [Planctomycetota bacterium]
MPQPSAVPSDPSDLDAQLRATAAAFAEAFGGPPTHAATAPGRVNLIGEHIDYCDGFVLPMAIERQSVVVARPRRDTTAKLRSTALPGEAVFDVDSAPVPLGEPEWSRYLRGIVASGYTPQGFELMLDSNVPPGGGLSSSASIEVATATLFESMFGYQQDAATRALLCQMAEHRYGGTPCGIMDQFASSLCRAGHALLLDCMDRSVEHVPLADADVVVLVINSNAPHELSGGEYAERRQQCADALKVVGKASWRGVTEADVAAAEGAMDATTFGRARHVVSEIDRTRRAADAFKASDWSAVGSLMFASHDSLRDDFAVSTPELDCLVDLAAQRCPDGGVIGARMTGGGFGGCTVTLARADAVEELIAFISAGYEAETGKRPTCFVTRPAQGARPLPLPQT